MNYDEALKIAQEVLGTLAPHCDRITIAGSIRRQKPEIKDIEIVCIPKQTIIQVPGLFGAISTPAVDMGFAQAVDGYERLKGSPTGKYAQRRHPGGAVIDIFMATAENWGNILLIRTGDAEFSKFFLGSLLKRYGYRAEDGQIFRGDKAVPVREESALFDMVNLPPIAPKERSMDKLRRLGL